MALYLSIFIDRLGGVASSYCDMLQIKVPQEEGGQVAEARLGEGCCISLSVSTLSFCQNNLALLLETGNMAKNIRLSRWMKVGKIILNVFFTGIKYENIFTKQFHPKTGQIPYIELNGEQIGDSNMIIEILKEKFIVNIDKDLTGEQLAMSHAATQMVECFTAQTGFHYRYGYHMKEFASFLKLGEYYASEKMIKYWSMFQPYGTRLRNFMSGLSRHENSVVWELAAKDLSALSTWLGNKEYFHGSEPTTVDCMLFGHLVQFLYIDIGFPQKVNFGH